MTNEKAFYKDIVQVRQKGKKKNREARLSWDQRLAVNMPLDISQLLKISPGWVPQLSDTNLKAYLIKRLPSTQDSD